MGSASVSHEESGWSGLCPHVVLQEHAQLEANTKRMAVADRAAKAVENCAREKEWRSKVGHPPKYGIFSSTSSCGRRHVTSVHHGRSCTVFIQLQKCVAVVTRPDCKQQGRCLVVTSSQSMFCYKSTRLAHVACHVMPAQESDKALCNCSSLWLLTLYHSAFQLLLLV